MTKDDILTFDGITQPIAEWALDYGIPASFIISRLAKGMPVATAITRPMRVAPGQKLIPDPEPQGTVNITLHGRTMTVLEWSKVTGMSSGVIYFRIKAGWPAKSILTTPVRKRRGVVSNFASVSGTGAGSTAQETPNLEFSE